MRWDPALRIPLYVLRVCRIIIANIAWITLKALDKVLTASVYALNKLLVAERAVQRFLKC